MLQVPPAGVEPNPIMSNGFQRIDHAVERRGVTVSHELRIVMNMFTAVLGGRANTLHCSGVPDSGDLRIRGRGPVEALVGRLSSDA